MSHATIGTGVRANTRYSNVIVSPYCEDNQHLSAFLPRRCTHGAVMNFTICSNEVLSSFREGSFSKSLLAGKQFSAFDANLRVNVGLYVAGTAKSYIDRMADWNGRRRHMRAIL